MKKVLLLGVGLSLAFAMTSCKSQESAYKKAYEKAKQQQQAAIDNSAQQNTAVEVTPVTPVTQPTTTTTTVDVSNVPVRQENVTVVSGNGLNAYSVVCGSFGNKGNAERLQATLKNAGYAAQIAFNSGNSMYRVVATTFADKHSAVQSRDKLRATYPDAWLLYKK